MVFKWGVERRRSLRPQKQNKTASNTGSKVQRVSPVAL
jgi:hypothetical protein